MHPGRRPNLLWELALPVLACLLARTIIHLAGGWAWFESVWGWLAYGFMVCGVLAFLEQVRRFLAPAKPEPPRRDWYSEALAREPGGTVEP